MFLIIALNVIFAVLVVGGILGLLGRSIWASRVEPTARGHVHAARPATTPARGRRQAPARVATSTS